MARRHHPSGRVVVSLVFCVSLYLAASEDFSFKKEDRLLCIDCPCGFVVPHWPSAAPFQAHHTIEEEARAL